MKKLFSIISIAALSASIIGCTTVSDPQSVNTLATSIGAASGTVCKMSITNNVTLSIVCKIIETAENIVPDTNTTCVVIWRPIITNVVYTAYNEGKICDDEVELITAIGLSAAHGVDWMFTLHPNWKKYNDISIVAIKGFCSGFRLVVQNAAFASTHDSTEIDELAYSYFLSVYKIKTEF